MNFRKLFPGFATAILLLTAILLGLHYVVAIRTELTPSFAEVLSMYLFIVLITLGSYALLILVGARSFNKIGFAFLGLSMVKIMISFVYLWPYLRQPAENVAIPILNFFIIYFIFLFFEAREVYKLLIHSSLEKDEKEPKDLDNSR